MNFKKMLEEKKEWRENVKRVKNLPLEYQIVYEEIQKYFFKAGNAEMFSDMKFLYGLTDLFENGANNNKSVLEVTGEDVASFCDELMKG